MRWTTMRIGIALLLAVGLLMSAAPTDAALLAWYRMGDDDGGLTAPPVDGVEWDGSDGSLNHPTGTAWGPDEELDPTSGGSPFYSSVVPGSIIYDPIADANYPNAWAMQTTGGPSQYGRTDTSLNLPEQFTHEVFFRYDEINDSTGMDISYHMGGTGGGWRLNLLSDGKVQLRMDGYDQPGSALEIDSTTSLTAGQWHHVAVIFDGKATNGAGVDDVHLYIDYNLEVSGDFPDSLDYSVSTVKYRAGATSGSYAGRIDEARYFNEALDPSVFLTLSTDRLKALVHPVTGEMVLYNATPQSIDLSGYEIHSPLDALLNANGSWNSLSDQNLDPVDGGDEPGETWVESGGSGSSVLSELFLLGSTTLDAGDAISVGAAYNTALTDNNMTMNYQDLAIGSALDGLVEIAVLGDMDGNGVLEEADINPFVQALTDRAGFESAHPGVYADLVGDFNENGRLDLGDISDFKLAIDSLDAGSSAGSTVPEPSTLVLLSLALIACTRCRRKQKPRD